MDLGPLRNVLLWRRAEDEGPTPLPDDIVEIGLSVEPARAERNHDGERTRDRAIGGINAAQRSGRRRECIAGKTYTCRRPHLTTRRLVSVIHEVHVCARSCDGRAAECTASSACGLFGPRALLALSEVRTGLIGGARHARRARAGEVPLGSAADASSPGRPT